VFYILTVVAQFHKTKELQRCSKSCPLVVLTFTCFTGHIYHWRNFSGIQSCTSVIKKLRPCNGRLMCFHNRTTRCEEITVRMGSLKMVSVGNETGQSGK